MIPFVIEQARPNDDSRHNNVIVNFNSVKNMKELNEDIINYIVSEMYDFCSEEYGHGINITSYSDYCEKYYKTIQIKLLYWNGVFEVRYFTNEWINWDVYENNDKIMIAYNKRLQNAETK